MAGFTKSLRQKIVREFAIRHNGTYNPNLFVQEVRREGAAHPAYDWFEWDRDKAALAFQLEQAREFARDLRVTFSVQVVSGGKCSVKVRETAMPMVLSPIANRKDGGGYVLVDPEDPAHMVEHVQQAAQALRAWWGRYRSAVEHVGADAAALDEMLKALEAIPSPARAA